ncbi:MAG TPA: hypothetical protein VFN23_00040 [Ktedonobacteraceae bacterium]|nr:hypothetical protein [Ktedonobacteraceae bacterium]
MNPQIHSQAQRVQTKIATPVTTEMDMLTRSGFTEDEIISLLWLRQWYQSGGSDRMEVIRQLEFVKLLVLNGTIER